MTQDGTDRAAHYEGCDMGEPVIRAIRRGADGARAPH